MTEPTSPLVYVFTLQVVVIWAMMNRLYKIISRIRSRHLITIDSEISIYYALKREKGTEIKY